MCGLNPRRTALHGTEMRACWTAAPSAPDPTIRHLVDVAAGRRTGESHGPDGLSGRQARTFVPVDGLTYPHDSAGPLAANPGAPTRIPGTWWLWGDPEP